MQKHDVVVIGGGVAGLATGALLAKQGYAVAVLEKGNQLGGRAYSYEEKGFTFNYGAHGTYRPYSGLLAEVMRRLGRPPIPHGIVRAERSYWADGDRFGFVGGKPQQMLSTALFAMPTRLRFMRFAANLRVMRSEPPPQMTFGEWLSQQTSDEALRRFVLAISTVNMYARPVASVSARYVIRHLRDNLFARDYVGYMSGGWKEMYGAFADELRANGGDLITGGRVERLEFDGLRIAAATTADRRYEAGAFVCALQPQDIARLAGDGTPLARELAPRTTLRDIRVTTLDLGFRAPVRDDVAYIFDIERDLYYSLQSEVTPDLAPEGGQMLYAMAYLSPEEAADERLEQRRYDELVAGLDRFFPGWRDATVVQRPLRNVRVAPLMPTPDQLPLRLPLRSQSASNLYFAGDACDVPQHLAMGALSSSMRVADGIAADVPPRAKAPLAAVS